MLVGVLGGGSFGTGVANVIAKNGHLVNLWSYEKDVVKEINDFNENKKYLNGVKLSNSINAFNSLKKTVEKVDIILIVVPSFVFYDTIVKISKYVKKTIPLGIMTKGFSLNKKDNNFYFLSDILLKFFDENNISYIYGPTNALELSKDFYSGFVSASISNDMNLFIKDLFDNDKIRVNVSNDIYGVQLGALMKNIYAIFYGMILALEELYPEKIGYNAKSYIYSLFGLEMDELTKLFVDVKYNSISNLVFTGDMFMSCNSSECRNTKFGYDIIKNDFLKKYNYDIEKILNNVGYLSEGVYALKSIYKMKNIKNLNTPIIDILYKIIYDKFKVDKILNILFR